MFARYAVDQCFTNEFPDKRRHYLLVPMTFTSFVANYTFSDVTIRCEVYEQLEIDVNCVTVHGNSDWHFWSLDYVV